MTNLQIRILSAVFLGSIFIASIIYTTYLYYIILGIIAIGMIYEWYRITNTKYMYVILGLILIPISVGCIVLLRIISSDSNLTLFYFSIIWVVDIFGFIGGKSLQGPKLAPKISPNKTWSGLITGVFVATIVIYFVYKSNKYMISPIIFILPILSQLSDLFVSIIKRRFNVKDSGKVIPGHGGLLDRFDSIIFTAPVFLFSILDKN